MVALMALITRSPKAWARTEIMVASVTACAGEFDVTNMKKFGHFWQS
jgi:hypothetical protein